jgi:hypothetical protein
MKLSPDVQAVKAVLGSIEDRDHPVREHYAMVAAAIRALAVRLRGADRIQRDLLAIADRLDTFGQPVEDQWYGDFIEIHDDWGRIGNLHWANSNTTPHRSYWSRRLVTSWGCFIPHVPRSNIMYSEEVVLAEVE